MTHTTLQGKYPLRLAGAYTNPVDSPVQSIAVPRTRPVGCHIPDMPRAHVVAGVHLVTTAAIGRRRSTIFHVLVDSQRFGQAEVDLVALHLVAEAELLLTDERDVVVQVEGQQVVVTSRSVDELEVEGTGRVATGLGDHLLRLVVGDRDPHTREADTIDRGGVATDGDRLRDSALAEDDLGRGHVTGELRSIGDRTGVAAEQHGNEDVEGTGTHRGLSCTESLLSSTPKSSGTKDK